MHKHRNLVLILDCYGTSINEVLELHDIFRSQFIELYKNDFLANFHKMQIDLIKDQHTVLQDKDGLYVLLDRRTKDGLKTLKVIIPAPFKSERPEEILKAIRYALYALY